MRGAGRFWKTRAKQYKEGQRYQSALVSGERDQLETRSVRNKRGRMFRPSCFRGRTRELLSLAILSLLCIHSNKQTFNCRGQRKLECRLDEHLKFTGKTSDQRKCSRSALTGAYVDKRVAGKKGSTNKIISTPPYLCRREIKCSVRWIGGPLEVWTQPLPPPGLVCVMQDLKLLSFKVQWFRDMGASCFGLRFRVLCFRNYP